MDEIVLPKGVAGISARRLLRRYLKELAEVESHSTDLQCEIAVCEFLLKNGTVDVSFAGQAQDMRRAFYAVKRMLG